MRHQCDILLIRAVYKLFFKCGVNIYFLLHHPDDNRSIVYNTGPDENSASDYCLKERCAFHPSRRLQLLNELTSRITRNAGRATYAHLP